MQRTKTHKLIAGLFLVFSLFRINPGKAQSAGERISVGGGMGNYEYLHGSIHYSLSRYFLEGGLGIKPWDFNKNHYLEEYISAGKNVLRLSSSLNAALQIKFLHWSYKDKYTSLSVLSAAPEIRLAESINRRLQLCLKGGVVYNDVLGYKRKTYEEIGWINRFDPSFSLQLFYSLR